jgi:hypothetical protein
MYTVKNKIVGGWSIKYLLEQLPELNENQKKLIDMLSETTLITK